MFLKFNGEDLGIVLFLTLIFREGVFYYVNYKILWLELSKSIIISKELACFTKGYFMTVLRGKKACPFRGYISFLIWFEVFWSFMNNHTYCGRKWNEKVSHSVF